MKFYISVNKSFIFSIPVFETMKQCPGKCIIPENRRLGRWANGVGQVGKSGFVETPKIKAKIRSPVEVMLSWLHVLLQNGHRMVTCQM